MVLVSLACTDIDGAKTTIDSRLQAATAVVPALPPNLRPGYADADSEFVALPDSSMTVHRRLLSVYFAETADQATRSALIARIGGTVVGGAPDHEFGDGPYYVEVPIDPTGERNLVLAASLDTVSHVIAAFPLVRIPSERAAAYRRP